MASPEFCVSAPIILHRKRVEAASTEFRAIVVSIRIAEVFLRRPKRREANKTTAREYLKSEQVTFVSFNIPSTSQQEEKIVYPRNLSRSLNFLADVASDNYERIVQRKRHVKVCIVFKSIAKEIPVKVETSISWSLK